MSIKTITTVICSTLMLSIGCIASPMVASAAAENYGSSGTTSVTIQQAYTIQKKAVVDVTQPSMASVLDTGMLTKTGDETLNAVIALLLCCAASSAGLIVATARRDE